MFLKTFLIATPVIFGGLYIAGSFDIAADTRDDTDTAYEQPVSGKVGDPATCLRYFKKVEAEGLASSMTRTGEERGFASGVDTILRVHKMAAEADRLGCGNRVQRKMRELDQEMGMSDDMLAGDRSSGRASSIKPGKPMLDARPASERERW